MKTIVTFFYVAFAILLAASGALLLLEPLAVSAWLQPGEGAPAVAPMLGRQSGLGLLLAGGINLFLALRPDGRAVLHPLVLLYLAGMVAAQGPVAFGTGAWFWVPVLGYLAGWLLVSPLRIAAHLPTPGARGERGEVKWFNPTKGFGFLVAGDGREVFVHFRAVQNGGRRSLRQGQQVRFTTRASERGEQADRVWIETPRT